MLWWCINAMIQNKKTFITCNKNYIWIIVSNVYISSVYCKKYIKFPIMNDLMNEWWYLNIEYHTFVWLWLGWSQQLSIINIISLIDWPSAGLYYSNLDTCTMKPRVVLRTCDTLDHTCDTRWGAGRDRGRGRGQPGVRDPAISYPSDHQCYHRYKCHHLKQTKIF